MNNDITVQFVSTVPGITEIEDCLPRPAGYYTPDWWKKMPANGVDFTPSKRLPIRSAKICPGIQDFLNQGYVLPMWADTVIRHNPITDSWEWYCGENESRFSIRVFDKPQFITHAPKASFLSASISAVFQFQNPWNIIAPKGYSLLQLPMFYQFNEGFSAMPGIVDADIYHSMNIEVYYHGNGSEVFIKRGTPIIQYIPFKRISTTPSIRVATSEDEALFNKKRYQVTTKFRGWYRDVQRQRDGKKLVK